MTTFGDAVFQRGGVPVGGDLLGLVGDGQVFYVDPGNGTDDANKGKRPDQAFATFDFAYDNGVVDGRGDVIIRMPGTETVTAATTVTKEGCVVVAATSAYSDGAGRGAGAEYYLWWGSALTDAACLIIRQGMSLVGLSFANAFTDSGLAWTSGSAVSIQNSVSGDQGGFTRIQHCEFPSWGSNNAGLHLAGAAHVFVNRNSFGGASGTLPVGVGLYGTGTNNPINNIIEDNYFTNVTTGVLFGSATPQETYIVGNTFGGTYTDAVSWAGCAASGTIDGVVARNNYSTAVDAATYAGFSGGSGSQAGQIESDSGMAFSNNGYSGTE
jgi:hypothetical protein